MRPEVQVFAKSQARTARDRIFVAARRALQRTIFAAEWAKLAGLDGHAGACLRRPPNLDRSRQQKGAAQRFEHAAPPAHARLKAPLL